jgi:hypothetical protein
MKVASAVCTGAALLAELVGIYLILREGARATESLQRWRDANPEGHADGSYGQHKLLNTVVEDVLGSRRNRWWAVFLLIGGATLGAVANWLSL